MCLVRAGSAAAYFVEQRKGAVGRFNRLGALAPSEVGNDPCGRDTRVSFSFPCFFWTSKRNRVAVARKATWWVLSEYVMRRNAFQLLRPTSSYLRISLIYIAEPLFLISTSNNSLTLIRSPSF